MTIWRQVETAKYNKQQNKTNKTIKAVEETSYGWYT